jgi:hypothetical protein
MTIMRELLHQWRRATVLIGAVVMGSSANAQIALPRVQTRGFQSRPAWSSPDRGGFRYGQPGGPQGNGWYQNGGGGFAAGGQYQDPRGNAGGGSARFKGRNSAVQGYYRDPNGSASGYANRNSGRYDYSGANGDQRGGYYQTNGPNPGAGYYNYDRNGYGNGGGVSRQPGGGVVVQGEQRQAGVIPFTQDRRAGRANFQGRDSSFSGRYGVYDPTGRVRFGEGTANLDRRQYTQSGQARLGPAVGEAVGGLIFNGLQSTAFYRQNTQLFGVGSGGLGGQLNSRPNVSVPKLPRSVPSPNVSLPKVTTPNISVPRLPSPNVSIPSSFNPF